MPHNKSERTHELQNKSKWSESSITLKPHKAGHRAPNVNNIPKQES
ncbi:hypothetical protein [Paenibacillus aquistagni]|uniref:Uncharacterized protein n=1 Tax=Paenibacillus aquistagni TaxID=1852522 RepID=A0A1X7I848_9BACL|nr:hypothetical protein [Paenibacillus aquistagni]NMM51681.1 hypothetical protein [Paenibacillus aquistagni]SMG10084.1 hypothetical protein SAMN06295960_0165 [Paenibacillus aquistagni]